MNAARLRPAWLRLTIALGCVVPVFALHLTAPALTGTRGTLAGALVSTSIAIALGWFVYVAYVQRIEHRAASELAVSGAAQELSAGLVLGAALFSATIGILAALGVYRVSGVGQVAILWMPFVSALGTAFIEEIVFRGIVFRIVESALGTWLALSLSSALFGLLHLVNPQATLQGAVAIVFEAGVMLAGAYLLTRRLWLAIGIHAGWNFTQGGIFGVTVSGHRADGLLDATLTGPEWLSGGKFGAEASLVAVVLGAILGSVLIAVAWHRGRFVLPAWRRPDASAAEAGAAAPPGPIGA